MGFSKSCTNLTLVLDRYYPLVLVLYTNEFIIARSTKQLMISCEKNLPCEVDMMDNGSCKVDVEVFLVLKTIRI